MKIDVNREVLTKDFVEENSHHVYLVGDTKTLHFDNVSFDFSGENRNLVAEIIGYVTNGETDEVASVSFKNCSFNSRFSVNVRQDVRIDSCDSVRKANLELNAASLKIVNSPNLNKLSVKLIAFELIVNDSSLCCLQLVRYQTGKKEGQLQVKLLSFKGKTSVHNIHGLSDILKDENSVIVYISKDFEFRADKDINYRILKIVANRQNDTLQALIVHGRILDNVSNDVGFWNRVLLFFEKYTNYYGQLWVGSLLWMILVNISVLVAYVNFDVIELNTQDFIFSAININPLHRFIETGSEDFFFTTSWQVSLDTFRQLVLSALAYQTIVAARRFSFVKK